MKRAVVTDFSRVLLFPKDKDYDGSLNALNARLKAAAGAEAYNVLDHFYLNEELLDFYRSLRNAHPIFLFTTSFIQNEPPVATRLEGIFKEIYSVRERGWHKKDPASYLSLVAATGFSLADVIYVDDNPGNVAAAEEAGLTVIRHRSNEDTIKALKESFKL